MKVSSYFKERVKKAFTSKIKDIEFTLVKVCNILEHIYNQTNQGAKNEKDKSREYPDDIQKSDNGPRWSYDAGYSDGLKDGRQQAFEEVYTEIDIQLDSVKEKEDRLF